MEINKTLISNYELYLLDDSHKLNLQFDNMSKQDAVIQLVTYAINNILHYTPEEAASLFTEVVSEKLKLKKQIDTFVHFPAGLNKNEKIRYLVSLCFPKKVYFNFKKYAINIYKEVSENGGSYPNMFFSNEFKEQSASLCLTYAITRDLTPQKLNSIEELYAFFADTKKATDYLKKVRLDVPLKKIYYEDTLKFLHFSLEERNQKYFLYEYFDYLNTVQGIADDVLFENGSELNNLLQEIMSEKNNLDDEDDYDLFDLINN